MKELFEKRKIQEEAGEPGGIGKWRIYRTYIIYYALAFFFWLKTRQRNVD